MIHQPLLDMRLREIERADLPRINRWRNDPELTALLGANFLFIGGGIDEHWFDSYIANRDKAVRLAIVVADTHIGNVNLTSIHSVNRAAEFSIFIGDKTYWSAGFGPLATTAMLHHGFDDLNLHRIYLSLLADNERARRMYQRLGFREEGCQHEAVFKNGRYQNLLTMAMLRSEFTSTNIH